MSMQTRRPRALALALLLCPLLFGCAFFEKTRLGRVLLPVQPPLPEQIYRCTPAGYHQFARVGIFRFAEPASHANVGRTAAEMLSKQLTATNIFTEVVPLLEAENQDLESRLEVAAGKKLDLIATGRILYYLDGTAFQDSRVDEEFTVYNVKTREILWQATAVEIGRPQLEQDHYLYKTAGRLPPPPAALLARNTTKFINLLQWVYPETGGAAPEIKPAAGGDGQPPAEISEEPLSDEPAATAPPDSSQTCKEGQAEGGESKPAAAP